MALLLVDSSVYLTLRVSRLDVGQEPIVAYQKPSTLRREHQVSALIAPAGHHNLSLVPPVAGALRLLSVCTRVSTRNWRDTVVLIVQLLGPLRRHF